MIQRGSGDIFFTLPNKTSNQIEPKYRGISECSESEELSSVSLFCFCFFSFLLFLSFFSLANLCFFSFLDFLALDEAALLFAFLGKFSHSKERAGAKTGALNKLGQKHLDQQMGDIGISLETSLPPSPSSPVAKPSI